MLPIVWDEAAQEDLAEIVEYISDFNQAAAEQLRDRLERAVLPLSEHPFMYPESHKMPGCREIVAHPNYLIFYRPLTDRIRIEMVAHGRRHFPIAR